MKQVQPTRQHWIDFESIPDHLGALSGGEQRLLRIAASIGSSYAPAINLGDEVSGLDRATLRLASPPSPTPTAATNTPT